MDFNDLANVRTSLLISKVNDLRAWIEAARVEEDGGFIDFLMASEEMLEAELGRRGIMDVDGEEAHLMSPYAPLNMMSVNALALADMDEKEALDFLADHF